MAIKELVCICYLELEIDVSPNRGSSYFDRRFVVIDPDNGRATAQPHQAGSIAAPATNVCYTQPTA